MKKRRASRKIQRQGNIIAASEGPTDTPPLAYDGIPYRIVCVIGDSNMLGIASGYNALDKATYPPPVRGSAAIWDQAGHTESDVLHSTYQNFLRPLTQGYAGGIEEPWVNGGDGIGPEFGMAAEIGSDSDTIRTVVVKMGLGGSYAFLGTGWNWNASMTGANAALSRFYNEHFVPAKAAVVDITGSESHIAQVCVVSLIGGNDMYTARSPTYLANMTALIAWLRSAINPTTPTDVEWCIAKQPLYEQPLGTPFQDITTIRANQDSLHDPVNGITTLDIGQPTPGADELHWDAAGQYTVGRSIGVWLKSVAP